MNKHMANLKGFSLPLSPEGKANLLPPPPWHYSGDFMTIEYRADPDAVIALLPDELEPADDPGAVNLIFADWQSCSENGREITEPYYSQYKEVMFYVGAKYKGKPVCRCVYIWVDKDYAMLRGLVQGFPKKLGEVWMTRPTTVGKAGMRLEPGGIFAGTLSAGGRRLVDAKVTLKEITQNGPTVSDPPLHNSRHLPGIDGTEPAIYELVTFSGTDKEIGTIWYGDAEITLFDSPFDELKALEPKEMLGSYYHSFGYTFAGGKVLEQHKF
ncbi:acetoacetate decarboxylase family protein [Aneurinibacillus migulanus]|uniref:acetoacetate decarboxylase family protein n=1 Tax=Aneurinibacillus migulanus TaxID=47500 RepID=UPI0020A1868F|nr:acetoacetate decarboxylase family protein [Aneurinibacillus migulanus]MCP1358718.1 acetoacetate decarboxylase family protein [Aneurinibacillus migulanus]